MEWLEQLASQIQGEVRSDITSRNVYSVDASIYEIIPKAIVIPKNIQDIITTVKFALKEKMPIAPRGAATGITGSCLGEGIILDTSKYLNHILEIDYENEYAVCEPGVIQDQLNNELLKKGYRLGPDTSTGNRATLAGMLANNAAGARSLYYGKMVDHILSVEMVLSNGELITFQQVSQNDVNNNSTLNKIQNTIYQIKEKYHDEILKNFPILPRRVSGYNLDELLKDQPLNLSKLIAGSEGTLGVITKIKLKICKCPSITGFCVLFFDDLIDAMNQLNAILTFHPFSLELIDSPIIEMGKQSQKVKNQLEWLLGNPKAIFVVEFTGDDEEELNKKIKLFYDHAKNNGMGYAQQVIVNKEAMDDIWAVRKAGLGLLLSKRTYNRAIAFIEDISVAPHNLANFMIRFQGILTKYHKEAGIYGHAGSGCLHIRPYLDLRKQEDRILMQEMMIEVTELLQEFGGVLSGEHGDGYIRSWLNKKLFGPKIYQAFIELKEAFDPYYIMNPHKIVDGLPVDQNLKFLDNTPINKLETFLDFSKEGGFELAADLCNGNGECRKPEKLMCPSFQASKDEYDTTRARAQTLRSIINGRLSKEAFTGEGLRDVLDLCVECKGCKRECPSSVDMAKMKSEILYHYQQKHGISLRTRLFASIHRINRFLTFFPFQPPKFILKLLGITTKRNLPIVVKETFSAWYKKENKKKEKSTNQKVILFIDTFTEYNNPEIGISAWKVLNHFNFDVIIPELICCGRTYISKGLLPEARHLSKKLIEHLYSCAEKDIPIIILEPGCLSAVIDDASYLVDSKDLDLKRKVDFIQKNSFSFEKFLLYKTNIQLKDITNKEVFYHRHCHQKALEDEDYLGVLLNKFNFKHLEQIPTGCCGLAGSFGYEEEHYEFSMKIGELRLFPFIRNLIKENQWIISNGVSCRNQIEHGTQKESFHISQFIEKFLLKE